jgi:hypothetical protein
MAISGKEFPCLAGLFAQRRRCRVSYIALLCAFCSVLPLAKHPPPYGKIILGKRLSRCHRQVQQGRKLRR